MQTDEEWLAILPEAVYQYQKKTVRKMILKDHKRPDGRAIASDPSAGCRSRHYPESTRLRNVYPRTDTDLHDYCTLAPLSEVQKLDGLDENDVPASVICTITTSRPTR